MKKNLQIEKKSADGYKSALCIEHIYRSECSILCNMLHIICSIITSAFAEVLILRVILLDRSLARSLTPVTQKLK